MVGRASVFRGFRTCRTSSSRLASLEPSASTGASADLTLTVAVHRLPAGAAVPPTPNDDRSAVDRAPKLSYPRRNVAGMDPHSTIPAVDADAAQRQLQAARAATTVCLAENLLCPG